MNDETEPLVSRAGSHEPPIFRCRACRTEFEEGVTDPEPAGEVRCPQCGLTDAEPIERTEYQKHVIRRSTRFR